MGGVVAPALIAYSVGFGVEGMDRAWAVPVATDIAFALAVLAMTGSRIPASARVFLLSLAVVDDLMAILLIAVLFTTGLAAGLAPGAALVGLVVDSFGASASYWVTAAAGLLGAGLAVLTRTAGARPSPIGSSS